MSKTTKSDMPQGQPTTQATLAPTKKRTLAPKYIYMSIVLILVILGTLIGVMVWQFSAPSVEGAFKSIAKSNSYAYTAYISRPTTPNQIIYIENSHNKRAVDTGINKFVVDYSLSGSDVGVYTEINNVWIFEEVFRGDEGTGLNSDNRALKAFDIAVENLNDNFEYNKTTKRYELKATSYHKVYANSLGGSCEIYRTNGNIYIDAFYGLDANNKERIAITKVGGVKIKLPAITSMGF